MANTAPSPTDTKNQRWTKILIFFQSQPGSKAHNNHNPNDSLRTLLVKVLRAIKGI
jgi:hypothetical protein